jgi:hypothetical protein
MNDEASGLLKLGVRIFGKCPTNFAENYGGA